jgi:predicted ArsR family transcriptional regulator
MADSSHVDGETRLSVHNCVLHAVATCLPEVCDTELHFLEDALGAQVERRSHIMGGCNACEYAIDFGATESASQVGDAA